MRAAWAERPLQRLRDQARPAVGAVRGDTEPQLDNARDSGRSSAR
jgi:hypothetical protein